MISIHTHYFSKVQAVLFVLLSIHSTTSGQEPLFGIDSSTLWQEGFGIVVDYFVQKTEDETRQIIRPCLAYGVTTNLELSAELPLIEKTTCDCTQNGIGNLRLTAKYKFYSKPWVVGTHRFTAVGEIIPHTSDDQKDIARDSTDVLFGLVWGWSTLDLNAYASASVRTPVSRNSDEPTIVNTAFTIGQTAFINNDLLLLPMVEIGWNYLTQKKECGVAIADSQQHVLYLGPTLFGIVQNKEFRCGIQGAIAQSKNNNKRIRLIAGFEFVY